MLVGALIHLFGGRSCLFLPEETSLVTVGHVDVVLGVE